MAGFGGQEEDMSTTGTKTHAGESTSPELALMRHPRKQVRGDRGHRWAERVGRSRLGISACYYSAARHTHNF